MVKYPELGRVNTHPKPADSCPCNKLTVVQFYPLEALAAHEVLEGRVCDERTVVKFKDGK